MWMPMWWEPERWLQERDRGRLHCERALLRCGRKPRRGQPAPRSRSCGGWGSSVSPPLAQTAAAALATVSNSLLLVKHSGQFQTRLLNCFAPFWPPSCLCLGSTVPSTRQTHSKRLLTEQMRGQRNLCLCILPGLPDSDTSSSLPSA